MTGFGFPGEDLFNWVYHALKGYKCNYCKRKLPKKEIEAFGVCSFRCKDRRTCGVLSRNCKYCKHHVETNTGGGCVVTGKIAYRCDMRDEKGPCGWDGKLFEEKPV